MLLVTTFSLDSHIKNFYVKIAAPFFPVYDAARLSY